MRHRNVYRGDGWVLAVCSKCQRTNYCEPHGVTAQCRCSPKKETTHTSIPEDQRIHGLMGPFVTVDRANRLKGLES